MGGAVVDDQGYFASLPLALLVEFGHPFSEDFAGHPCLGVSCAASVGI